MYRKILVPVDGSELSECSLDEVGRVAGEQSEVLLLRVVEPAFSLASDASAAGFVPEKIQRQFEARNRAEAGEYVELLADRLKKKGVKARAKTVAGAPAAEVIKSASEEGADLIIITTHGRSGISRWALGSVADKVLRTSRIPVLLVTPSGCRLK